ncbi:hypothetical protein BKA70DRAFT_877007 [Coprinopsis sp. MPI-PUGE-AT-0042]|nr:hypothetical protein BKA70DRAFT_877007 [Coprinopsis sp. MPI-PUGE-AT-0042]
MPYWSSELSTFAESLQTEGPFRILDDILAVVIFSGFSVIETRILYRLIRPSNARRSSKSSRSSRLAAVVTITLGLAYVVCAALTLVNFMVKLALVTRYSRGVLDGSSPPACPTGYSLVESWPLVMCQRKQGKSNTPCNRPRCHQRYLVSTHAHCLRRTTAVSVFHPALEALVLDRHNSGDTPSLRIVRVSHLQLFPSSTRYCGTNIRLPPDEFGHVHNARTPTLACKERGRSVYG